MNKPLNKPLPFTCLLSQDNCVTVSALRETDAQFPHRIEGGSTAQPGDVVLVKGIPFLVMSDDEAEAADAIMVQRRGPSPFKDNLFGQCAVCRAPVMYRPHAPKKPRKVCMECADEQAAKALGVDVSAQTTNAQTKPGREMMH